MKKKRKKKSEIGIKEILAVGIAVGLGYAISSGICVITGYMNMEFMMAWGIIYGMQITKIFLDGLKRAKNERKNKIQNK